MHCGRCLDIELGRWQIAARRPNTEDWRLKTEASLEAREQRLILIKNKNNKKEILGNRLVNSSLAADFLQVGIVYFLLTICICIVDTLFLPFCLGFGCNHNQHSISKYQLTSRGACRNSCSSYCSTILVATVLITILIIIFFS